MELDFVRVSLEQGLSQNNVTAIAQDNYGFIWFGTLDGLNKYDGSTFKVLKHIPCDSSSLSSSTISALLVDQSGNLWVGTMAAGLNKVDLQTGKITSYQHDPDDPNSLSDNHIRALFEDRYGSLWIGTRDGGLILFDREANRFFRFEHDPKNPNSLSDNNIRSILEDYKGNLWIGAYRGGINLLVGSRADGFDPDAVSFMNFKHDPSNPKSLSNNHVEVIYEDRLGDLWIGTYGGGLDKLTYLATPGSNRARSLNPQTVEFSHYKHEPTNPNSLSDNYIESLYEDHTGVLWVGTSQGGLNRFDRRSERFYRYTHEPSNTSSISHNNIETLYEDRSEILWIGTWGGGINKVDRKPKKFSHYKHEPDNPNTLSANYVRAIYEDASRNLWVGSSLGGLDRFDRKTGIVTHYTEELDNHNSLSSNDVRAVHVDDNAVLWVGTYGGGLNKAVLPERKNQSSVSSPPAELSFKRFLQDPQNSKSISDDYVWCIQEDYDSVLWIGTNSGLNRFDPTTETFTHYKHEPDDPNSLSHDIVRTISQDSSGRLWIGTYDGLNRFDPETGKFIRYNHDPYNANTISHNSVVSIFVDNSDVLWIGTLGGGLNKFDPETETFTHYLERDGLPNAFVHAILEDEEGNLWLSTNKGLAKFNEKNPEGEKFRNYDVKDGLQSNEFNVGAAYRSKTGEMFFGGIHGFNSFFPQQVKDNPYMPSIVLTGFKIFNHDLKFDQELTEIQEIELSYKDNFYSFEFAALDFTNPEKNQFAYKMEGFDSHWVYSGTRRYASYTNLNPGEYVFRVKGSNNDGIWNDEGISVKIKIVPPLWQTWWFRIMAGVGFVAVVILIFNSHVKKLKKQKQAQEKFSQRLIEIQEQERKRIASELHDSLGQNLLIISNGLLQCLNSFPGKGEAVEDLQRLSKITLNAINEVREISYNLHPHQLDRLGFKKAIESIINKFSQASSIKFVAQIDDIDGIFPKDMEINLFRIVQESLNNVVRHSEAGKTRINVKKGKKEVKMLIEDDGQGFDAQAKTEKGFGLAGIAERVKILKGKFLVNSSPGKGTVLRIRIPI
jgi:signal transduction histidine kinase/ligand-binding sensor domain-containing protein